MATRASSAALRFRINEPIPKSLVGKLIAVRLRQASPDSQARDDAGTTPSRRSGRSSGGGVVSNLGHPPTGGSSTPHRVIIALLFKPSCAISIASYRVGEARSSKESGANTARWPGALRGWPHSLEEEVATRPGVICL